MRGEIDLESSEIDEKLKVWVAGIQRRLTEPPSFAFSNAATSFNWIGFDAASVHCGSPSVNGVTGGRATRDLLCLEGGRGGLSVSAVRACSISESEDMARMVAEAGNRGASALTP